MRLAPKIIARFFFALALYCPTLEFLFGLHTNFRLWPTAVWGLVLAVLPAVVPYRIFKWLLAFIWVLSPLIIGMLGYISMNGMPPPFEMMVVALKTNSTEISGALESAFLLHVFRVYVTLFLTCMVIATLAAWTGRHTSDYGRHFQNTILALGILALAFVINLQLISSHYPDWDINIYDAEPTVMGKVALVAWGFVGYNAALEATENITGGTHEEATEKTHITAPALSILVIGESMRLSGLSPQTKERGPWSKQLNDRVKQHLAAWLPPVCATRDSTGVSVPTLITGVTPDHYADAATRPTGLSRLRSAGYDVAWIASGQQGIFAGPEVFNGKGFYWHSPSTWAIGSLSQPEQDASLFPVLENFVAPLENDDSAATKPKAVVMHLWGSHFPYESDYPKTMFPAESPGLSDEQLDSLRYERANENGAKTLATLADILDKIKYPAFAVYTSDHGDNLISDHNGLLRHLSARTSLATIMVPGLVIWNKAAKQSGLPQRILSKVSKAPKLAQVDVYKIWMSLSNLDGSKIIEPTATPLVSGALHVGDKFRTLACDSLEP